MSSDEDFRDAETDIPEDGHLLGVEKILRKAPKRRKLLELALCITLFISCVVIFDDIRLRRKGNFENGFSTDLRMFKDLSRLPLPPSNNKQDSCNLILTFSNAHSGIDTGF